MNAYLHLWQQRPLIALHLSAALAALLIGAVVLARRKGTPDHRALGWGWVGVMGATALSSAFIRDHGLPNIAGYTPIHLLTAFVAVALPIGILRIRRGDVVGHRRLMRGLFIGGCVIAGLFTLLPQRYLGQLLWHHWLGWV